MKIGILGTRGIPNAYGGFEQFAQFLSEGLVEKGYQVWVYNSSLHPYQEEQWNGVQIIHCRDWEDRLGTAGQFIYDYNCFTDARRRDFDILLQLGYTSSSVWHYRWPQTINIVNMDGLEWKRTKYPPLVRRFLKYAERLAALNADILVADSPGIQEYLQTRYQKNSTYIPYGAALTQPADPSLLQSFRLEAGSYYLMIARMEPENNIEMVINGYLESRRDLPLFIVGNAASGFGKKMKEQYGSENIRFAGALYDQTILNALRYHSTLYFHGHSVGGTNPSLLEAMACECLIAAHNNVFNRAILGDDADYFSSGEDVKMIIDRKTDKEEKKRRQDHNLQKIREVYNWKRIIDEYENLFLMAKRAQRT